MEYIEKLWTLILNFSPQILTALAILIIGLFLIRIVTKVSRKMMTKSGVDLTLQKFLSNLIGWALKILLFVVVIS